MKTLVEKLDLNTPLQTGDLLEIVSTMAGKPASELGRNAYRFSRESSESYEIFQGDGRPLRPGDQFWCNQARRWWNAVDADSGRPSLAANFYRRQKSAWSNPAELRTRLFAAEDEVEKLRGQLDRARMEIEEADCQLKIVIGQRDEMRMNRDEFANELRANLPRWVRIEDQLPTEADADTMGNVVIQLNGCHGYARRNALAVFLGGEWLKTKETK